MRNLVRFAKTSFLKKKTKKFLFCNWIGSVYRTFERTFERTFAKNRDADCSKLLDEYCSLGNERMDWSLSIDNHC